MERHLLMQYRVVTHSHRAKLSTQGRYICARPTRLLIHGACSCTYPREELQAWPSSELGGFQLGPSYRRGRR